MAIFFHEKLNLFRYFALWAHCAMVSTIADKGITDLDVG